MDAQQTRAFRNETIIPEKLNDRIHPGFVKMGSDFSVPTDKLDYLLKCMMRNYLLGIPMFLATSEIVTSMRISCPEHRPNWKQRN